MALYTIGDLHLSLGSDKPMDIFGDRWQNYVEKIQRGFSAVTENDTTVLCGVGINLYLDFVGGGHMDDLIAHIEHFLSLSGESTVAIGGDLDGCEALAAGMTGVQDVAKLYQALEERGYPQSLLEDIFWNNWRRIL